MIGTIYALRSPLSLKYYIGSTLLPINTRFSIHKSSYKNGTSTSRSKILFELDIDSCYIEIIEQMDILDKIALKKQEGIYIRERFNELVNCKIEGRTISEYRIDNRKKLNAYHRDYQRQYRLDNCEKIKAYQKEYQKNYRK